MEQKRYFNNLIDEERKNNQYNTNQLSMRLVQFMNNQDSKEEISHMPSIRPSIEFQDTRDYDDIISATNDSKRVIKKIQKDIIDLRNERLATFKMISTMSEQQKKFIKQFENGINNHGNDGNIDNLKNTF